MKNVLLIPLVSHGIKYCVPLSFLALILLYFVSSASAEIRPGAFFADGNKDKRAVALSFDDGPGEWTKSVLDVLDQYGIKATFFMNGDQVQIRPQIAKEVAKRGHEIGEHTYSHKNFYSMEKRFGTDKTKREIQEEMDRSNQILVKTLGFAPKLCRMPHGYHRSWLGEVAKSFNYTLVNWTFGEDWLPLSKEKMAADYIRHTRPGAILLFHDGGKNRSKTLEILPQIIEEAKKKGLTFMTVAEILE